METIQELSDRIDGMISSIGIDDINNGEFISHKYMLLSLHVHTEREIIERGKLTSAEKLSSKKIYNLYLSLEKHLNLKVNTAKTEDMYNHLIESQMLINNANEPHNK